MDLWNGGTPKLDSSMINGVGQRFGLTSKSPTSGNPFADHWLSFPYAAPGIGANAGDSWETIRALTIDCAIEAADGGVLAPFANGGQQYICGAGQLSAPRPIFLQARSDGYCVFFLTKEGVRDSGNQPRNFKFGDPASASGTQKISIQIDFGNNGGGGGADAGLCSIRAWINGVEQTVTRSYGSRLTSASGTEPSFTAADVLHFISSEPGFYPWTFWNGSSSGNMWHGGEFTQDRGTYSLYGFRLTNGTRYTTTASVQARADAGTLNDAYRYTGSDATTMCYLETNGVYIPKVGGVDGRYVWMVGPTAQGSPWYMGLFMFESIANGETTGSTIFQNMLSDMTVQMGASVGLLVGQHLNPTVERVRFLGSGVGAWAGIASTCGSVYDARIRDCSFAGCRMAWIALRNWIVEIENIWRDIPQRFALRFDSCYVKARNVRMGAAFVSPYPTLSTEAYVKITQDSDFGWIYELDGVDCDNEGEVLPTVAHIVCERPSLPRRSFPSST